MVIKFVDNWNFKICR